MNGGRRRRRSAWRGLGVSRRTAWFVAAGWLALLASGAPATALAQTPPRTSTPPAPKRVEMFRTLADAQIEELLAELKLKPERLDDLDKKFRRWEFTLEGETVTLLVSKQSDFQLYASFDDEETFRRVIQWNRDRRWAKAYIEEGETSVALEMDVDFSAGISAEQFTAYVKLYADMLKEFRKFLKAP